MALKLLPPSAGPPRSSRSALMTPEVHADGARIVLLLPDEADASTRLVLCDVLSRVIARRVGDVVIDLTETTFIDVAVIRVLATAQQLLNDQDRRLIFQSPSRRAARVLRFFGLADLIETEPARRLFVDSERRRPGAQGLPVPPMPDDTIICRNMRCTKSAQVHCGDCHKDYCDDHARHPDHHLFDR